MNIRTAWSLLACLMLLATTSACAFGSKRTKAMALQQSHDLGDHDEAVRLATREVRSAASVYHLVWACSVFPCAVV